MADTWRLKNRAMSIDNISMVSCATEIVSSHINKENASNGNGYGYTQNGMQNGYAESKSMNGSDNSQQMHNEIQQQQQQYHQQQQMQQQQQQHHSQQQDEEDNENIIPWRAQLRKTNSRLSLI